MKFEKAVEGGTFANSGTLNRSPMLNKKNQDMNPNTQPLKSVFSDPTIEK